MPGPTGAVQSRSAAACRRTPKTAHRGTARTVKALDRLASSKAEKGSIKAAGIKAANVVGKLAREDVSEILASIARVSRKTIKPRSKAASKYQAEPRYVLDFPKAIPVSASSATKFDKKTGELSSLSLAGAVIRFHAKKGRGRGGRFILPEQEARDARLLGGFVFTRRARNPEVERYASGLGPRFADVFESEFEGVMRRHAKR